MPWFFLAILAVLVVLGLRKVAREKSKDLPAFKVDKESAAIAQDTVMCALCKSYVVKQAPPCERPDCPSARGV